MYSTQREKNVAQHLNGPYTLGNMLLPNDYQLRLHRFSVTVKIAMESSQEISVDINGTGKS